MYLESGQNIKTILKKNRSEGILHLIIIYLLPKNGFVQKQIFLLNNIFYFTNTTFDPIFLKKKNQVIL